MSEGKSDIDTEPSSADAGAAQEALKDYLAVICPAVLNLPPAVVEAQLDAAVSIQCLTQFVSNADIMVLFALKLETNEDSGTGSVSFQIRFPAAVKSTATVAFVKLKESRMSSRPVAEQVQLITLGATTDSDDGAAFIQVLQQYTRHTFGPLVRSSEPTSQNTEPEKENKSLISLQRKIRELDLALEQCQRGVSIPRATLTTHPAILAAAEKVGAADLKGYLEKFNQSLVEKLFTDIGLSAAMGGSPDDIESFANEVNQYAKQWPVQITRTAHLVGTPFSGSPDRETDFWVEMEQKLNDAKEQLLSPAILLTKLVLKRTNRVSEQLIREAEIELDRAMEIAHASVSFLKDLPIADLMSATQLQPQMATTVTSILKKFGKLKHSKYDFVRAVKLLESIDTTMQSRLVSLLRERFLLVCPLDEFKKIKEDVDHVLRVWDNNYSQSTKPVLVEMIKRSSIKGLESSLTYDHAYLGRRLKSVSEVRELHVKMLSIFSMLAREQGAEIISSAVNDLEESYNLLVRSTPNVFDFTPEGAAALDNSLQAYETRLERIEESITRLLEESLSTAKSADEMFRIFSTFNQLFFRPAIRNAVNTFRVALVKTVREDVKRLQEKFRFRYDDTTERETADLRDVPPLSGRILWARQIEHQLTTLMKRMENVLGVGWEDQHEGKQLKEVCDELRSYLDTDQLFKEWARSQKNDDAENMNRTSTFLLLVDQDVKHQRFIRVNFDIKQMLLFKEVRYLEWLLPTLPVGPNSVAKTIPTTVRTHSKVAFARYPVAMALQDALSALSNAKKGITEMNMILLVSHIQGIRDMIGEAILKPKRAKRRVSWESTDLNDWVAQLSNKIYVFQERVEDVSTKISKVDDYLNQLKECPYEFDVMASIVANLQTVVDEMQTRAFSNIAAWVGRVDAKIEEIISARLTVSIGQWVDAFIASGGAAMTAAGDHRGRAASSLALAPHDRARSSSMLGETAPGPAAATLDIGETVHEILLSNQILYINPPLESSRAEWVASLHRHIGVVSALPRLSGTRYNVFAHQAVDVQVDFSNVVFKLGADILSRPFAVIEEKIHEAHLFVRQWLQYQALWDASAQVLVEKLGGNIGKWRQLLTEIKTARATIESSSEEVRFGPVVINYRQVQNKINLKYDTWQRDSQLRFSVILLEEIRSLHAALTDAKAQVEAVSLEGPTKEVISGVECILKMRATLNARKLAVEEVEQSEKLLQRQRFQFPADWLSVSNVSSAFDDFSAVLERRKTVMNSQLHNLQLKIRDEENQVSQQVTEMSGNWERDKPVNSGSDLMSPVDAMQSLSMYSVLCDGLAEDLSRIKGAKEALGLDIVEDNRVELIAGEIADLREVWQAVSGVWEKIQAMRGIAFKDIVISKIRKQLDEAAEHLRSLPGKVRTYSPFERIQELHARLLSVQPVLRDLCAEALKDRHWKLLLKALSINVYHSDLTLGDMWDCNPMAHRKIVSETLSMAQGELALEQFLKDLKEYWSGSELTLVVREGGVRLITGWDVLFSMLEDHLNSLSSLKQSPYFRNVQEFQEDTTLWEGRLTSLRGIFEVWIEVQRKWVYLKGIFRNPDIKAQLPSQFSKFKGVESEFTSLMKRVSNKPAVVELLQVDNLFRQLERQDASMSTIQKALGEYLEKQRQIFPRFYFVNNDDLVEIIGNSNEPSKIVGHMSKMFAGITTIALNPTAEGGKIESSEMSSREGEVVKFLNAVDISLGVKEWLCQLENEMRSTIAGLLQNAIVESPAVGSLSGNNTVQSDSDTFAWMNKYPAQVIILASQIVWSEGTENALATSPQLLQDVLGSLDERLKYLSECVLQDMEPALRKKCEQMITEVVHQRDVTRLLVSGKVNGKNDFGWLFHLRFYWNPKENDLMQRLSIRMSNAAFYYGFEYLGIGERLVQTPLTDRCYLTLTQALHFGMGGNPFGPAGTGKTESVKMLGSQLGRFVLVFNCDENFDYAAMGRIFAGLCQVGAWGCFDEFNRLEERILSAVSQQILTIQRGLMAHSEKIELLGNQVRLHKDVGIFVTMNPGYAGRSNLPDNLKQLFRAVAMSVPDRKMIAQVMLFSQGIVSAEELAGKIVLLFTLCEEQLSLQSHYDFGLRALKSVLTGAGDLKRKAIKNNASANIGMAAVEKDVLIRSTCGSVVPKLVADDIALFTSILQAVFPGTAVPSADEPELVEAIRVICAEDGLEFGIDWVEKILQLKQVLDLRHGVMLVGPSFTGKTTAWRTLLKALSRVDGIKGEFFVIDPKSIKKDKLYGVLDPNTLEWTDGVFTKVLRRIIEAVALRSGAGGASATAQRRSWIVFDGDVDPEWAENLNSVLDDNKLLTLPSGDRLKIPDNVRIMMEVDTLKHATLATVSRCGMVWFSDSTLELDMILKYQLFNLSKESTLSELDWIGSRASADQTEVQNKFVEFITPHFTSAGLVGIGLEFAMGQVHVMDPSMGRLLNSLQSMLVRGISIVLEHNEANPGLPVTDSTLELFAQKWLLQSLVWSFGASMVWERRSLLSETLLQHSNVSVPSNTTLLDVQANPSDGGWTEWASMVPKLEIESHKVTATDVVVTTTDTLRHTEILRAWLSSHKPVILCGPPGSGKTMSLTAVIDSLPEYVLASLNFSSASTPDLILKTFAQYCETVDSPDGLIMQPSRQAYSDTKWLVIFCDEINLPEQDKYGTQRVIMFMRQLTEQNGFWNKDCKWVRLRRIQFVGAGNPPTDAGRVPLSERFLRHCPLLLVDYPAESSLTMIYRCFNHGLLKLHPNLKGSVDALTDAMVAFYRANQSRFLSDVAPQYVYSPRELSRWVRAMYEAMYPLDAMTLDELVRLWAHEGMRLFHDRLISPTERSWCEEKLDSMAELYFPSADSSVALKRPMLFSNWLSKTYQSVNRQVLRDFVAARLKVFYEEELDVPLVIFDDVLEHVLRIDNVLRHPMGHMLLVGESGVGKTVLTRFVSWMNGLSVFQIKANSKYGIEQFDEDLRTLLRRVGIDGEKICFIFDESNALSSAFLERMNALLASGEIPGLFEGDERAHLLTACRDSFVQKDGILMDSSEDELWRRFTRLIQRNLHVVFTMNPASSDFDNRCTTSPALFNRCVVDWFGTWSTHALAQVGYEFTAGLDTGYTEYNVPSDAGDVFAIVMESTGSAEPQLHEAVVAALVSIHDAVKKATVRVGKVSGRQHYLSPRDYLDLINKFVNVEIEKRTSLEEKQTHIRTGLEKLLETQNQVAELKRDLHTKEAVLKTKDAEANQKLGQMVEKQNEAENRKGVAEELTKELTAQNEVIRVRREEVETQLAEAEPALQSAKLSVQNIRKAQLDELRALARPPAAVQLTMEVISVMMGEKSTEWGEIRKFVRRDDFIATVVNFDPMSLTVKQIRKSQEYFENPELSYDAVDRASKACGPLFEWAKSQIHYSTILRKIKPLREEVESLQTQSDELEKRQREALEQIDGLQSDIETYKKEYATAIRDTEVIRNEMTAVTKKCARAESLLASLDEEKDRWQTTSVSFDVQMSTLIGDCLLAAGFLTYAGIFDHRMRINLAMEWSDILDTLGIPFRKDIEMVSYLSTPSDQMAWRGHGMSADELAIQNCILLERFNRFPLVIDPSGQATTFFMKKYASQKIIQTSFQDSSFLKTLASAIRFGTPLLVQDVEAVDPILNPVLNRELQKTGGRTLIRIGNEDIDFSPKFMIILTTRNPQARFAPDLCSRVTTVNFTVTTASLEAQVLSAVLRAERPDIDNRRTELLHLQGEQSAKLRELEEKLLSTISAAQGAILDDDTVINSLETIKGEAASLNMEVAKTESVMEEVKSISNWYEPLASAIAAVYFTMEKLGDVSFLYQFSLQYFLNVLNKVLFENTDSSKTVDSDVARQSQDAKKRVATLSHNFFVEINRRVSKSLKFEDKLVFAMRLAQISTQGVKGTELTDAEYNILLRGSSNIVADPNSAKFVNLKNILQDDTCVFNEATVRSLLSLMALPSFANLESSMANPDNKSAWSNVISTEEPESALPADWMTSGDAEAGIRGASLRILLMQALRPDRIMSACEGYVYAVFGDTFPWRDHAQLNLQQLVECDSKSTIPIMVCSEIGQDISSKVDGLAVTMGKNLLQVAMGSAEGYAEADRNIAIAAKSGVWVLLRNVHLCPEWLNALEKRLHNLSVHDNFRLFLTCEISPKLPSSLLRASEVVIAEASTGLKANLQRFFMNISPERMDRQPAERSRLYSLLAWFNAVVQERLRYTPLGWSKKYEFSEADAQCALNVIDQWVDSVGANKAHVAPENLPWKALRTVVSQSLYGGRVDNAFDQAALDSFITTIFQPSSYGGSVPLAMDYGDAGSGIAPTPLLTLPDGFSRKAFEEWIENLPNKSSPLLLGLPATAEQKVQSDLGNKCLAHLSSVQTAYDTETVISADSDSGGRGGSTSRLSGVQGTVELWLKTLPEVSSLPTISSDKSSDVTASSMDRCLAREIFKASQVLSKVRKDLELVKSFCAGQIKGTNDIRGLISSFLRGAVPLAWFSQFTASKSLNVGSWVTGLAERCSAVSAYKTMLNSGDDSGIHTSQFWLGGMFNPEAFITASRQATAQANEWSLEDLELTIDIGESACSGVQDTIVKGLMLEGAGWSRGSLVLSAELRCALPSTRLRWGLKDAGGVDDRILFPLYLNELRSSVIAEVYVTPPRELPREVWSQRGVGFVMQSAV